MANIKAVGVTEILYEDLEYLLAFLKNGEDVELDPVSRYANGHLFSIYQPVRT